MRIRYDFLKGRGVLVNPNSESEGFWILKKLVNSVKVQKRKS